MEGLRHESRGVLQELLAADLHEGPGKVGQTMTPTELAAEIWGDAENHSRSRGARAVRRVARELFPGDAPGKGREWQLTPAQVSAIRRAV